MGFACRVEQDSVSPDGVRLATVVVTFPRCILPEMLTHRQFSRSTASSRAIPAKRMIEAVEKDPFVPEFWGRNQAGMQAGEALNGDDKAWAVETWLSAKSAAVNRASELTKIGAHKQLVNRLLEPFAWTTMVISSTSWPNFFELRCHPDAEPHMQKIARMMRESLERSEPADRSFGEWHLPFITYEEREQHDPLMLCRWSAARCARVSYLTHEGKPPSAEEDERLFQKLAGSRPLHASPLEHQASATRGYIRSGNFDGWRQHRKLVEERMAAVP